MRWAVCTQSLIGLCTHHAAGDDHQVADERLVGLGRLRQARNVLTGQNKEVRGSLRCDIAVEGLIVREDATSY